MFYASIPQIRDQSFCTNVVAISDIKQYFLLFELTTNACVRILTLSLSIYHLPPFPPILFSIFLFKEQMFPLPISLIYLFHLFLVSIALIYKCYWKKVCMRAITSSGVCNLSTEQSRQNSAS